ncbi:hypothetical protein CTAYLR_008654 [Chrysophaeum taylorii]|uniref:PsbP C-terminal domain-containing protein n=1 Tax=Chrysophaeum taylorii TaxID=2483200 RepID=A0AAD7U5T6_9STRA|nr:hypothetical protein CTAYLR_008654 [Chrysophaeum taylorii]
MIIAILLVARAVALAPNETPRRQAVLGGVFAAATGAAPALAAESIDPATSRMGGQLEKFVDVNRGFRLMKPTTWNQFDGEVGAYDLRWTDLVETTASVTVSSSSYSGASIDALADVDALGGKLQKSRSADLLAKRARVSDGVLFYDFEFGNPTTATHELLAMCVNKNRLWQISAKSPEKSWAKRADLLHTVVESFVPKL